MLVATLSRPRRGFESRWSHHPKIVGGRTSRAHKALPDARYLEDVTVEQMFGSGRLWIDKERIKSSPLTSDRSAFISVTARNAGVAASGFVEGSPGPLPVSGA